MYLFHTWKNHDPLETIKVLLFYRKRTHLLCYLLGMGNPLQFFKLALTELQELQTADVKACCLYDESENEKNLVEGKYSIVYGTPEVA